jgi:hypothetical protein
MTARCGAAALCRADERVSKGQASERAVCVCEAVSVEKGARRLPLPAAVVCPPGGRRRRRLAITSAMPAKGTTCFRNFSIGNDLFTTFFTAQMGRISNSTGLFCQINLV